MSEKRASPWWSELLEILGEGLFDWEAIWWLAAVAICVLIVVGIGYALYQIPTDSPFATASLGTDISTYFDSISINPDKWR